ncbi:MAG TPA: HPF/RaiA family ribosome-associated protein [Candidatus Competibacteraceae bacterium]|nr:HPF/RaiA family ribosome-associated protein [Candidatus Competibacteraceae bacterium]
MQLPLQITFRDMPPSPAVEAKIREKVAKLEQFYDRIMSCRVVVEAPHRHHHQGKLYRISIDLTVPGGELAVSRNSPQDHAHEDIYVAIRDAFDALRRQLADYARRQRRDVKSHETPLHGQVARLMPEEDYGVIQTPSGREIYFHRHSVLGEAFDKLDVGSEVRFAEEEGEQGPQASTVHPIGKHHIVGEE